MALLALPLAYLFAALIGGSIPVHRDWRPPADGVRVFVEDNGIHTGIVVPVAAAGIDWRGRLRSEHLADPRFAGYGHVAFGWGDRDFYVNTPDWRDLRVSTVLHALTGSSTTVMHVEWLPEPQPAPDVRSVILRPEEYRRLARFIAASFAERPAVRHGYFGNDAFYTARGRYSAGTTCNSWTGAALRAAGVRVGRWTPLSFTVMWWF